MRTHSIEILPRYQRAWVDDGARWKFGLWARQTGKDFSSGFEGVRDCVWWEEQKKKTTWLIAAPSERQSLEALEKWKEMAKALGLAIAGYQEERGGPEALLKAATITFPHGSRVIAVPGQPDTVRGFSANVLLTEFAFFENPDATWRAILPSVTNPLRGGLKKVRLITTPNGLGNMAYDLWSKNYRENPSPTSDLKTSSPRPSPPPACGGEGEETPQSNLQQVSVPSAPTWSCHKVTIWDAVNQGLRINAEELRAAYDNPEGWAQEYECEFLDIQSTLLPYEVIAQCESTEATDVISPEFFCSGRAPIYLGIDFGRRHDLTVCWAGEKMGDVLHTREVLALAKLPTPEQQEILRLRIRRAQRVCLDYTGPGIGLGDYLVKEFGQYDPARHRFGKIELCTFTNTLKVDIFSKLRMAFERRQVRVPIHRVIREDLHSVNRTVTPGGQLTYKAPQRPDGHADRCTALALCHRAAGYGSSEVVCGRLPGASGMGNFGMGKVARDVPM